MGYKNGISVGSCDGNCPLRGARCSPCPELKTEDNRTPITEGLRVYNYYDGFWGVVEDIREDGWFTLRGDDGSRTSLNGTRVSSREI